jgi:poly(hydroxyalkanoate) depolymerase family esterase
MPPPFHRLMAEATRLTRNGELGAATAALRTALAGLTQRPAGPAESAAASARDDALVIDVEARLVDEPPVRQAPEASAGEFVSGRYADAAGARDYKLYVPPEHRGRSLPLVVMLHGCTQDPEDFARGTGMNDAALERGFFVLYPAQSAQVNPQRCWNWFKHNHQRRGQGEPALLAGMTREVMKRHDIDPRRVYVAGLSAGGAMAAILGETYPDLYAAVGVHSGLPAGAATDIGSALAAMNQGAAAARPSEARTPTIVFHGDRDATVHPANGEQIVAAQGGARAPEVERACSANGREYTRSIYRDENLRVVAEHWVVHGAAHAWSGGSALGSYTDARGPDATEELLRFFFANPKPSAM